jgi:hypothetical protein
MIKGDKVEKDARRINTNETCLEGGGGLSFSEDRHGSYFHWLLPVALLLNVDGSLITGGRYHTLGFIRDGRGGGTARKGTWEFFKVLLKNGKTLSTVNY